MGDIDLLHDEVVDYAARLEGAGVPCELLVEHGMYHGADVQFAASVESMHRFRERLIGALGSAVTLPG